MTLEELREEIKKALSLNVNDKVEKKNDLTYLSWSWCFQETMKIDPQFSYKVLEDINGLPYWYDDNLGYIVKTEMTILGITRSMWLPVMNANNYAMKNEPYEVKTKNRTFNVDKASMMDINKTIMRCLVKNVAVCIGLGLYIYAGEDLPEEEAQEEKPKVKETPKIAKNKDFQVEEKEIITSQKETPKNADKVEQATKNFMTAHVSDSDLPFDVEEENVNIKKLEELQDKIVSLNFQLNKDVFKCYDYYCKLFKVKSAEELNESQLQQIVDKLESLIKRG